MFFDSCTNFNFRMFITSIYDIMYKIINLKTFILNKRFMPILYRLL